MRLPLLTYAIALLSFVAIIQAQPTQPTFEVASVKPSQNEVGPDYNNQITVSATEFNGRNVTLKRLIAEAWQCQLKQIVGPAWIERNEYDIAARIPAGASREQIPLMLRSLLSERFHLKEHGETRQIRVYELKVGEGGPKIKPIVAGDAPATNAGQGFHFHGTMRQFADLLALQFSIPAAQDPTAPVRAGGEQIPVMDKTGLPGIYDFSVPMRPELGTDAFTGWSRALHDQLGLKIESRKGDVPVVVVDDVAKTPTGN